MNLTGLTEGWLSSGNLHGEWPLGKSHRFLQQRGGLDDKDPLPEELFRLVIQAPIFVCDGPRAWKEVPPQSSLSA